MGRPLVAGNWKMHNTLDDARVLMKGLRAGVPKDSKVEVVVCPPYTLLYPMGKEVDGTPIKVGAQNCYCERQGAFTGEISPKMIKAAGCDYVIIGHSERRHIFGEGGDLLKRKVSLAVESGLMVIYCVGETLEERDAFQTEIVVEKQLREALNQDIDPNRVVLAYEPVWAIGTGRNATPDQAQSVHAFLRAKCEGLWGKKSSDNMRILYGGSVKPDNAKSLMVCPDVDGALVGGACLAAESFLTIVGAAAASR